MRRLFRTVQDCFLLRLAAGITVVTLAPPAGHLKVVFYLLYDFETLAPGLRLLPSPTAFALPETEILSHEVSGGQG